MYGRAADGWAGDNLKVCTGDHMDMMRCAPKAKLGAVVLLGLILSTSIFANDKPDFLWDSGFDSFCDGPCISAYKSDKGAILRFIDPADGVTKFIREVNLPEGSSLGKPVVVGMVDVLDEQQIAPQSLLSTPFASIPSPPASGNGVVASQATIRDSLGHAIGTVIIYYVYVNGVITNIQIVTIPIVSHSHVER